MIFILPETTTRVTSPALKPVRSWGLVFPTELFWCGVRQDGRRAFLPLMCLLSLLLTILVLWGAAEGRFVFRRTGGGILLLPFIAGTVFGGMVITLGLNVPFALRAATADDDLPLIMLTGVSPLGLWRVRVLGAALQAWAIPLVHLPLIMFLITMGGITTHDLGAVILFWLAGWLLAIGWSSLAGCVWTGAARDRMQGMALTFTFAFLHGMGLALVARVLWWMDSPWAWWTLQSLQPPWQGTLSEFLRLGAHVLIGGLAAWTSVIVLRGRWRLAVETGSSDPEPTVIIASVPKPKAIPVDDNTPSPRQWAPVRPRCGLDPWFWKDFHVSGGSWKYWGGRVALAVVLAVIALNFCVRSTNGRNVEPVIVITMVGWFIWMMFDIGQVLTVEFQDRMWSVVRITPNSVPRILSSKLAACAARLAPSLLPVGLVCLFGLLTDAHMVVIIGIPVLLLIATPIAALILYGSAIPQTMLGAGWPMVKTLAPLAIAIFSVVTISAFSNHLPRDLQGVLLTMMWSLLSVSSTVWLIYATVCELNNPARERLSADGG